jgi:PAS domain S-box-containing protein
MSSSWRDRFLSLALGLAAALCGLALRSVLYPVLGPLAPGLTFVPFLIAAAWLGGTGAGIVATLAGYGAARYIFDITPPTAGPLSEGVRVLLFLLSGTAISWLTHSLRTARNRAERERRNAATILSSVTDGLIGLDREFRLSYLNAAAEKLLGCSRGDVLGEPLRNNLTGPMSQRVKFSFEYHDQKSNRWFDVHAYPDEQGGLSVLLRDIAERKQAEQGMAEANRALERSNGELQQFAYFAAHDLREPLRNLMNSNELIARRYSEVLGAEGRELLDTTIQGARRMRDLVDDLLVYCQAVGQGDATFSAVDCDAMLTFLLGNFSPLLTECGGQVTWERLPNLCVSESQVLQLFQNLLGNALKYRSGSPPLVHIAAVHEKEEWIFSIQDNGIGIAPQYREEIFGLFRRLHASHIPGTGLGLAICKRIVEHYGGRIWVQAQEGSGSTFYFSFPEARVQEPVEHTVQPTVAQTSVCAKPAAGHRG